MHEQLNILLAAEPDDIVKIIFGALFVLVWIVGGLLASTRKKRPQAEQRSWEDILRDLGGEPTSPTRRPPAPRRPEPTASRPDAPRPKRPSPVSPPPLPSGRQQLPQRPRPAAKITPKKPKRPLVPPVAMEHAAPAANEPIVTRMQDVAAQEIGSDQERASVAAEAGRAAELSQWLSPGNLRRQFILTEILRPPVALADDPQRASL